MSVANLERRIDWPQDLVDSSITDRFDWLIAYGEITVWRRCSAVSYNKRWRGEKERQQRRDLNQSKEVCTRLWHSLIPTYTFTFELKFIRHTVLHTSFRVLIYHFYVFTIFCFFFLILRHTHCTSITCFLQSPYLALPLFDRIVAVTALLCVAGVSFYAPDRSPSATRCAVVALALATAHINR